MFALRKIMIRFSDPFKTQQNVIRNVHTKNLRSLNACNIDKYEHMTDCDSYRSNFLLQCDE
ncbi:hypothetical protein V1478_009532 [Vespula squamosa]|uniref:Uncharacterized protein n=1 Tax=Vespula squamosa TaxID=30214 RepID=A0ABD2APX2_VESSQ